MARIDLAKVLNARYIQKPDGGYKPDVCEAYLIRCFVEHIEWADQAEAKTVLDLLIEITLNENVIEFSDGTLKFMVETIALVAEAVGLLEPLQTKEVNNNTRRVKGRSNDRH